MEKYGMDSTGLITIQGRGPIASNVWRGIARGCTKFQDHTAMVLRGGSRGLLLERHGAVRNRLRERIALWQGTGM